MRAITLLKATYSIFIGDTVMQQGTCADVALSVVVVIASGNELTREDDKDKDGITMYNFCC